MLGWKSTSTTEKLTTYPETYSIEISTDDGKTWYPYIKGYKELYYNFNTLIKGIPYQFRVKAHNTLGSSEATDSVELGSKNHKFHII